MKLFGVIYCTLAICSSLTWAETSPAGPNQSGPVPLYPSECQQDVQRFCKKVKPGEGRIAGCLREHAGKLSEACKTASQKIAPSTYALTQTCKSDIAHFCPDVPQEKLASCLQEHEKNLITPCAQELHAFQAHSQRK